MPIVRRTQPTMRSPSRNYVRRAGRGMGDNSALGCPSSPFPNQCCAGANAVGLPASACTPVAPQGGPPIQVAPGVVSSFGVIPNTMQVGLLGPIIPSFIPARPASVPVDAMYDINTGTWWSPSQGGYTSLSFGAQQSGGAPVAAAASQSNAPNAQPVSAPPGSSSQSNAPAPVAVAPVSNLLFGGSIATPGTAAGCWQLFSSSEPCVGPVGLWTLLAILGGGGVLLYSMRGR